ncbi:hypothetical protein [Luteolibacter sp. Populi]|uniref:hypothetical protein n=1 Tax=Luteolibacter sp. Populi TaxID=3230487 RepID=UPI0034657EA3
MRSKTTDLLIFGAGWALPVVAAAILVHMANAFGLKEASSYLTPAAVVLAGFSVAAFNLRFRIIDAMLKVELKKSQVEHLTEVFGECRANIDRCLFLFVFTTLILVSGKFVERCPWWLAAGFLSVGAGLFVRSLVRFLEILYALRKLEDFSLSMIRASAKHL